MTEHDRSADQNTAPCTYLEWDSAFWNHRVARVNQHTLTEATLADVLVWCADKTIDLLYFLAEPDDALTVQLAESNRFRLVDIRLTFEHRLQTSPDAILEGVRPVTDNDIDVLRAIAKNSYYDSRFYYDPLLPAYRVDALYETWITNSCNGYANEVLVADVDGQPSGFITCHLDGDIGSIGLVGVGTAARGQGIGRLLVQAALAWFAEKDMRAVTVVTQGRNVAAQRLYQRAGFMTESVRLWYHRWFGER